MDSWMERAYQSGSLTTGERLKLEQVKALSRIADAIQANAQATEMLARATAGEFDDSGEVEPALGQSLSDVRR